jgi:type II secretory pathway component PulM
MMKGSAARNRRALLLLGLAVIVYVAVSAVLLPLYDEWRRAPAQVAEMEDLLRKYRSELSHRGNYDALKSDTRKKLDELRTHFFTTDAAGAAELQKLVEDSARQAGVDLTQRTATQTKRVDDALSEISMSTTFEATLNQVVAFLNQLRATPKLVNVRIAQIDPTQIAYEPPKQGELKKSVRVSLTIAGGALTAPEKVN